MHIITMITYIIADDHYIFRRGLKIAIDDRYSFNCIGEAEDGIALMQKLETNIPDVLLLDIEMPNMNGIQVLDVVKDQYPSMKVIVLTMHDEEEYIINLMDLGCHGYLVKNADPLEIKKALVAVSQNGYYFSELVSSLMLKSLREKRSAPQNTSKSVVLTSRETTVLQLICKQCSTHEIAQQLCLSPRTVEGIRSSIIEKVGVKNIVGLVLYAVKHGHFSVKD